MGNQKGFKHRLICKWNTITMAVVPWTCALVDTQKVPLLSGRKEKNKRKQHEKMRSCKLNATRRVASLSPVVCQLNRYYTEKFSSLIFVFHIQICSSVRNMNMTCKASEILNSNQSSSETHKFYVTNLFQCTFFGLLNRGTWYLGPIEYVRGVGEKCVYVFIDAWIK